jgi:hypothetical protein
VRDCLDGASLGLIRQRVAVGQLSNLARILDRGAVMDLATIRPTETAPVWAAAATGRYATGTGIRSNRTYRVLESDVEVVDVLPDYCFAYALVAGSARRGTVVCIVATRVGHPRRLSRHGWRGQLAAHCACQRSVRGTS